MLNMISIPTDLRIRHTLMPTNSRGGLEQARPNPIRKMSLSRCPRHISPGQSRTDHRPFASCGAARTSHTALIAPMPVVAVAHVVLEAFRVRLVRRPVGVVLLPSRRRGPVRVRTRRAGYPGGIRGSRRGAHARRRWGRCRRRAGHIRRSRRSRRKRRPNTGRLHGCSVAALTSSRLPKDRLCIVFIASSPCRPTALVVALFKALRSVPPRG